MNNFKAAVRRAGYDQEEAFFHRENQRLINKNKNESTGTEQKNNVIHLPFGNNNSPPQTADVYTPTKKVA
jgi:hypothetical protein